MIQKQRNSLEAFRDIDKDIAQIMGTNSALRLVSPEYQDECLRDEMRVNSHRTTSMHDFNANHMMDYSMSTTFHVLKRLVVQMKYYVNVDQYHIRVGVRTQDSASLYFSPEYLSTVGLTQRDIRWVSEDLAQQLGNFINGRTKAKNH